MTSVPQSISELQEGGGGKEVKAQLPIRLWTAFFFGDHVGRWCVLSGEGIRIGSPATCLCADIFQLQVFLFFF